MPRFLRPRCASTVSFQRFLFLSIAGFMLLSVARPCVALEDDTDTESGDAKGAPDKPVAASNEGELALTSFRKPEGWNVTLFAAEPYLANPVALHIDHQGRLFICESFRQTRGVTDNRAHDREWLLADLAAETVQDRIDYHKRLLGTEAAEYMAHDDRIRRLEDTDGDGRVDRGTIFAEGFNGLEEGTGAGVLARGNEVYFTCIPKLWSLKDIDGDGQADERRVLSDGYGVRVAFRGHDSHGLIIGMDGRLYFSLGDRGYNIQTPTHHLKDAESGAVFRCELDGSNLEVFATGLRNPQELAFDDYGYLFTGDNNSDSGDRARWVNVMEGGDSGWRMMYQYIPDRGPFNREKIWHPYSSDTPGYVVPPIANIGDGPSGLTCYPGTGLTGDYDNCFFLVDFRGGPSNSGIRLIRSQPKGAFWEIERSEEAIWNILATDADFGPDGRLYVSDWVDGWVGEGKGRVYRFADQEAQQQALVREVESLLKGGFSALSAERLAELVRHLDRRVRLESQWELAQRGEVKLLQQVASDAGLGTLPRLHGIWGLGHAARINPTLRAPVTAALQAVLSDPDLDVRATALSVVGDLRLKELGDLIPRMALDPEPRVQYAACLASYKLQLNASLAPICQMLENNQDTDPGLRHAGIMGLAGVPDRQLLYDLTKHSSTAVRVAAVVALRKLQDNRVADFLNDAEVVVQLEAARAVHDVPELHSALDQLATLEFPAQSPDPLSHRILNAGFRLGTAEAARKTALFAANVDNSAALRLEAIEMLGTWSEPGELDRVMNRYSPLPSRSAEAARKAFSEHFTSMLIGPTEVVSAALTAGANLNLDSIDETLRGFASDGSRETDLREEAINGLVRLDPEAALPLLRKLALDDDPTIRAIALSHWARQSPSEAMPELRKALSSEDLIIVQQSAWDDIAQIKSSQADRLIADGLEKYLANAIPPGAWLNAREAILSREDETLKKRLAEFESGLAQSDPLQAYRECQTGGDVERGSRLFFEKTELSCVRCHKVNGTGGEVGPDLSEIAKTKDDRYLLESIVLPDAQIAKNFETAVLLTEDDEIISGIVRRDEPTEIELINAEGEIIQVDPDVVVARKKGNSAMPADLLKAMTRRELRDLVAYLASLKSAVHVEE